LGGGVKWKKEHAKVAVMKNPEDYISYPSNPVDVFHVFELEKK